MKYTKIYLWACMLGILSFGLSSCNEKDETSDLVIGSGEANFAKFISVGNSLTAGFSNQGLYNEGMENAFVSIMAAQFKLAGGGDFYNPTFPAGQENGTGYLILEGFNPLLPDTLYGNNDYYINNTRGELGSDGLVDTVLTTRGPELGRVTNNLGDPSADYTGMNLNNFGVPGLTVSATSLPNYANLNPFFARIETEDSGTSYLDFVEARGGDATFFSCWLGNNDVLSHALAGGTDTDPTTGAPSPITDEAVFSAFYNALIDVLTENGAKGVVATIPSVTSAAHFTTITEASLLLNLNVNKSIPMGTPLFTEIYIETASGARAAEEGDLFLLARDYTSAFGIGLGISPLNPLPDDYVLDKDEVTEILAATEAFNQVIVNKANEKGLAIFDTDEFLTKLLNQEYLGNAQFLGLGFVTGGLFSLDGIHFTPRGNAFVANEMIKAVNAKYGSNVPLVDPNDYAGMTISQ